MKMLAVSLTLCTVLAISQAAPIDSTVSWDKGHCYYERMNCSNRIGSFCPMCDGDGNFLPRQCWGSTGYCWCVDIMTGKKIQNTTTPPGTPPVNCSEWL
uniref:Thyroglobulin type-1 domain-containing protein n=1 Tax=Oreochromis niloticus TaxID=8128 RepID=A0A669DIP4_ORENI